MPRALKHGSRLAAAARILLPALDLINSEYAGSIGLIFLTDLETGSFGKEPPFPTVWVNFSPGNRAKAPYGRTVDY